MLHRRQTGTVVPVCFKNNNTSQQKGAKFDLPPAIPKIPELMAAKIGVDDEVSDPPLCTV